MCEERGGKGRRERGSERGEAGKKQLCLCKPLKAFVEKTTTVVGVESNMTAQYSNYILLLEGCANTASVNTQHPLGDWPRF